MMTDALLALLIIAVLYGGPALHVALSERSHGGAKFGWFVAQFVFPIISYIVFLIVAQNEAGSLQTKKPALGFGKVLLATFLGLAIFMGYGLYAERSAKKKAATMCASIRPGADSTPLRDLAISDGATDFATHWVKADGFDTLFITYVGLPPFSRHICVVQAKDGHVVSAKQSYLD